MWIKFDSGWLDACKGMNFTQDPKIKIQKIKNKNREKNTPEQKSSPYSWLTSYADLYLGKHDYIGLIKTSVKFWGRKYIIIINFMVDIW